MLSAQRTTISLMRFSNGVRMPLVGFGCAGRLTRAPIGDALEAGYLLFDTSQAVEWYDEVELGAALNASTEPRERLFVTTKLHPRDLGEESTSKGEESPLMFLQEYCDGGIDNDCDQMVDEDCATCADPTDPNCGPPVVFFDDEGGADMDVDMEAGDEGGMELGDEAGMRDPMMAGNRDDDEFGIHERSGSPQPVGKRDEKGKHDRAAKRDDEEEDKHDRGDKKKNEELDLEVIDDEQLTEAVLQRVVTRLLKRQ